MRTISRLRRVAAAALAAAALTTGPAAAATAPPGSVTARPAGTGLGYNDVINGHPANQEKLVVEDGDTVVAYCVEEGVDYPGGEDTTFVAVTRAESGLDPDGLAKAADVAVRSAEIGTPLGNTALEAVAVQLAIWKLANGVDISAVANSAAKTRAEELAAAAVARPEDPSSFVLTAAAAADGDRRAVTVTLRTVAGAPIAGEEVRVSVGEATETATTGADGTATVTFDAPAADVDATVSWAGELKAGTVLAPPSGQKVITATDARIERQATVRVAAAAPTTTVPPTTVPATTVPPTTVPAAAPTTVPTPSELPYTGTVANGALGLAAAAATTAGVVLRRRARG